jgi:hypothetical protein
MAYDLSDDMTNNKLLVLYILDNSKIPLKNSQITKIILENDLMNYFVLQQCIKEIINTGQIRVFKDEIHGICYEISENGKETINYFYKKIPLSIREKVLAIVSDKEQEFKKEFEVFADYYPQNKNDFIIDFKILENQTPLIELKFTVGTKAQAKNMCDLCKNYPDKIYKGIIEMFCNMENKYMD